MSLAMFGFEAMDRVQPNFLIAIAAINADYLDIPLAAGTKFVVMLKPLTQAFVVEDVTAVQLAKGLDVQAYPALGLQDLHILCNSL